MKRTIYIILLLLFVVGTQAQDARPTHSLGLDAGVGYAHLFFGDVWRPYQSTAQPLSGWGATGALFYELEYNHFLFHTGFGVDYIMGRNLLPVPDHMATVMEYLSMQYRYTFSLFIETTTYGVGYVPVMFGGNWDKAYFLVGAKIGMLPFAGTTQSRSQVQTWATDPDIIDPLYDLPTHDMGTFDIIGLKQPVTYPFLNVMFSAEVGLNLDKRAWVSEKERKKMDRAQRYRNMRRKKSLRERTHVRLALFADYGLSNLHAYTPNATAYGAEPEGGIVAFNGLTDLQPKSMLGFAPYKESALNNLLMGVKVAVRFELPQKPRKKEPVAYPYIYVYTQDERTQKPLPNTRVQIINATTRKVRLDKNTDAKRARVSKGLQEGPYDICASRSGYFPHDTIHFQHRDDYDTLYVSLYPQQNMLTTVTDARSMRPVSADVTISTLDGTIIAQTTTDSLNNVLATLVDDRQSYIVLATATDYEPFNDTIAPHTAQVSVTMEPKHIRSFVLHNMYFATAKTKILPSSEPALLELFEMLSENPDVTIRIIGHTDDVGSDESNQILSEGRSKSVRQEMIKRGIDGKRIKTAGHGEKDPIVPNDSDRHRQMNRRVEIEILSGTVHIAH